MQNRRPQTAGRGCSFYPTQHHLLLVRDLVGNLVSGLSGMSSGLLTPEVDGVDGFRQ